MQAMTLTRVRDLKEGYLVDLEPALGWLMSRGHLIGVDELEAARETLARVDSVELEPDASDVAILYSVDGGNWALPADMKLPRVVRD